MKLSKMGESKNVFSELASELRNINHCVNFMIDFTKQNSETWDDQETQLSSKPSFVSALTLSSD